MVRYLFWAAWSLTTTTNHKRPFTENRHRGGRYTIGRREKSGRKCKKEGENKMLWQQQRDIDEEVILGLILACMMTRKYLPDFTTRLTQHKRVTRNGDVNSHIAEHHLQTKHQIDWDSATCITYSTDYYQHLTLESWPGLFKGWTALSGCPAAWLLKNRKIGNSGLRKKEKQETLHKKNRRKIGKSRVLLSTKIASRHLIRVMIKATSPPHLRLQDLDQLSGLRRSENDQ